MKKIINQKRYDTETAMKIGERRNSAPGHEFPATIQETLYRKRTGEFFLHGKGGSETKYSRKPGSGGEKLIPLAYEDAKQWAAEYLEPDEFKKAFGDFYEDDRRKVISVSLHASTIAKLKWRAAQQGKTVSRYIDMLVWRDVND